MTDFKPITPQEEAFVAAYLVDFNVKGAAEEVGIDPQTGYKWMKDPRIIAAVLDGKHKIVLRAGISADWTLEKLRAIAVADITDVLKVLFNHGVSVADGLAALPDDVRYAIKSVEYTKNGPKVVMHDKTQSLMAIGKYFKLFVDKVELTGANGGPVEMIDPNMTPEKAQEIYADMIREGKN